MKRAAALAVVLGAVLACASLAASAPGPAPATPAGPSWSGLWRLDTTKTAMGKRLPRSREDRMSEQGPWIVVNSLTIRASGDSMRLAYRYRTDGVQAVNRVLGQDVKTIGRRDGAVLRFDSEAQLALFKFTVRERWSLSPDGSTLTQVRVSHGPLGDERQRLVFRRER